MNQLIAWLHTLTPAQGVALSMTFCFSLAILFIWAFVLWKNRIEAPKIEHIPTEEDLRRRDQEGAKRAFIRYTSGSDKGKAA